MEIYYLGQYLSGIEVNYLVDGDVVRHVIHHRIKRVEASKKSNPMAMFGAKKTITESDEGGEVKKECLYFKRHEYISRLKVTGQKYLHYLEI